MSFEVSVYVILTIYGSVALILLIGLTPVGDWIIRWILADYGLPWIREKLRRRNRDG